jgi:hypothetical protein
MCYAPGIKEAYQGSSSFYRLQQRSKSFDCYKKITVSMWIKTNPHTGGAQSLFMLPKPLISGVISSH